MNWQAVALDDADNVAIVLLPIAAGDAVTVWKPGGLIKVAAIEAVPFCHKIALADLAKGDAVLRYGQCIGEAGGAIGRGAWVHVHNLLSRRARRAPNDVGTGPDIDSLAAMLDLVIPPESRAAVRANLMRLAETHTVLAGGTAKGTRPP